MHVGVLRFVRLFASCSPFGLTCRVLGSSPRLHGLGVARFALGAFVASAGVLCAVVGRADSTVAVHVEYSVAQGCPDALGFGEELRARAKVHFVGEKDATHGLVVRVMRVGKHFVGRLVFRDGTAEETERRVNGDTCAEVVSGLALVSAFALGFTPTTERDDAQPPPDVTPADSASPAPAKDAAPEHVVPLPTAEVIDASTTAPPAPQKAWSLYAGTDAQLISDISPNLTFSSPVYFQIARSFGGKLGVAFRVRLSRSSSTDTATFTLTSGALDLCPVSYFTSPIRLDLCARVVGGVFSAVGVGVAPARTASRPWVSVGPVADLDLYMLGPIYTRFEVAMDVPLVRDRFFVEPNNTVFTAPVVGWTGALGVGATIW